MFEISVACKACGVFDNIKHIQYCDECGVPICFKHSKPFIDKKSDKTPCFLYCFKCHFYKSPKSKIPLFFSGGLITSHSVSDSDPTHEFLSHCIERHFYGDFGEDTSLADWCANLEAIGSGGEIRSIYTNQNGQVFWMTTQGDRSNTSLIEKK